MELFCVIFVVVCMSEGVKEEIADRLKMLAE